MMSRDGALSDPSLGAKAGEVEAQIGRLERKRRELDEAIAELRDVRRQSAPIDTGVLSTDSGAA